jgi:hypothetical protein
LILRINLGLPWAIPSIFWNPVKMTLPHVRHVGEEEVTLSGADQYSYPQIRDQPNNNIWGVKAGFRF